MPRLLTKRGCWITLAAAPFLLFLAAWGADKLWPLPLHEVNPARVVVAQMVRRSGASPMLTASGVIR
ncbi:hypothetical protein C6959_13705 [Escherichia coli]|nr:hypothetical protein C2U36_05465 [Escherichia coli]PSF41947.1 hypothetical protein C6983_14845 [Escherichia coli]PSG70994.1 hypothetical protein C6959_13705 [Escherichia coli]RGW37762.1 hypothetical protein DWV81_04190 [Escherichia coli]